MTDKREYYVETRQVILRDCRVMATCKKEAKELVLAGKAGSVVQRPVETHKVTLCWPVETPTLGT